MTSKGIGHLSRAAPNLAEQMAASEVLTRGSPLAAAVVGGAIVEYRLEENLRRRLKLTNDKIWRTLTADAGPLSTFHQKITLAFALKLFDEEFREALVVLKNIRNAFAHSKILYSFETNEIDAYLRSVPLPKKKHSAYYNEIRKVRHRRYNGRFAFVLLVFALEVELMKKNTRSYQASTRNFRRKQPASFLGKTSPLALALAGAPLGGLLNLPLGETQEPALRAQTAGPNPQGSKASRRARGRSD